MLTNDIWMYICDSLSDIDKINFLSITSKLHILKCHFLFHKEIHYDKIEKLQYLDRFTNIIIDRKCKIPTYSTNLTLAGTENYYRLLIDNFPLEIPKSIKHLRILDSLAPSTNSKYNGNLIATIC